MKDTYTDGSGFKDNIGASATTKNKQGMRKSLKHHLGPTKQHTVYEAEITGMILATHMAYKGPKLQQLSILTDNQAVIIVLHCKALYQRSYLTEQLIILFKKLKQRSQEIKIKIFWVLGHEGVVGNKKANRKAKEAAQGQSSPVKYLPPCLLHTAPSCLSTIKQKETCNRKAQNSSALSAALSSIQTSLETASFECGKQRAKHQ